MKLFGKKTLALFLALSMMMSVCAFATSEGGEGTDPITVTSVTIDKESATIRVGSTIALQKTVAVTPDVADNKAVSWTSSDNSIATVNENGLVTAVAEGTATITATSTKNASVSDSCAITVVKPAFTANETASGKTFSVNTPIALVLANLDSSITVDLVDTDDSSANTATFSIGTSAFAGKDFYWSCAGYNAGTKGTYTFTATPSSPATTKLAQYNQNGKAITCTVTLGDYTSVSDLTIDALLDEYNEVDYIDDYVSEHVKNAFSSSVSSVGASYAFTGEDYGEVNSSGTYEFDTDYDDRLPLVDEFVATMTTNGNVTYKMNVALKLYTPYMTYKYNVDGGTLSAAAADISTMLDILYSDDLELIEFIDMDMEGGTLYDNDGNEVEADYFTKNEFAALKYQPNGSGEYSIIEYVAYHDYDNDDDEYIEGRIFLTADPYMMINIEVTEDDIVYFDSEVFETLFLEQDDDYEELSYVTFSFGTGSNTKGWLYYDYDEEAEEGTQVKSSKCYVSPDDDAIALDDVVFVPGSSMTAGTKTYTFTAKGYKDGSTSLKTETGYLVITFIETADITINANIGQTVEIDPGLFLEFIEDYDTSDKDLEIVSVTISGAPRSDNSGYLFTDDNKLTKSGDKVFYADEDDVDVEDKKYDLFDLHFLGGKRAATTPAEFKVCYLREGSSSKRYATGTIDFEVGTSNVIENPDSPLKASQVLPFYNELEPFASLGGNNNVCIVFTSLPRGAKLYYNYGTPTQEDVTVGTEYYITAVSGKKLLKNVTLVPSYSADKVAKIISFDLKGYNKNGKAITGAANISVIHNYNSLYFSDITSSLYADSVDFLRNQGITTGVPGGLYAPNGQLSRAELVTFLYRAAGSPAVYGTSKFTDVPTNEYYYKAVLWATQVGITKGTNEAGTLFSPNAKVTNQEIIQFMYNYDVVYLKHTSYADGSTYFVYDYNNVATWAQTAVKWAVGKNVLTAGNLNPTTVGIRGDIALYLHRMLTL